jgi:hypothetical protein
MMAGLRLGGRTVYAGGVLAAIGMVFLAAMFSSFAVRAMSPGLVYGWIGNAGHGLMPARHPGRDRRWRVASPAFPVASRWPP